MNNKKTIIFDLDGTLYYQYGVQCIMGCQMLLYYIIHLWRIKELMAIMYYRKIREKEIKGIVENQYKIVAKKYNMTIEEVKKLVDKWLFKKSLKIIKIFKDKKLCEIIDRYKKEGINIIIYSDYPTQEKIKALNIQYDKEYDSTHPEINELKPNPKGIKYIIKENNLKEDEILLVGDRDSKDGECARNCNIEYVILPKLFRNKKYVEITKKVGIN